MKHLTFEAGLDAWEAGDAPEAIKLWQQLANEGDLRSQYNLGVLYDQGHQGLEKNAWEAFHWFDQAAKQEYPDAQFNCALMLFNGEGCKRDEQTALYWLNQAASRGHRDALFNLGQMYSDGEGVPQDWHKAVEYLRRSAEQGHPLAANNLAIRYAMGQGITRSDFDAYVWFNVAALLGDNGAVRHRERVGGQLQPEDIVRAGKVSMQTVEEIRRNR